MSDTAKPSILDGDQDFTAAGDPFELFQAWLAEAEKYEINDPNAMALATTDAGGLPNVRMVLLRASMRPAARIAVSCSTRTSKAPRATSFLPIHRRRCCFTGRASNGRCA